jgi:hypothetical protein
MEVDNKTPETEQQKSTIFGYWLMELMFLREI